MDAYECGDRVIALVSNPQLRLYDTVSYTVIGIVTQRTLMGSLKVVKLQSGADGSIITVPSTTTLLKIGEGK